MYTVRKYTTYNRRVGGSQNKLHRAPAMKTICTKSPIFDENHLRMTGPICKSKHTVFRWKGDKTRKATLICDSLGKWFRAMANTDTQAIPGLNLDRAALRIIDGTLSVNNYTTILVMIGTNDVEEFDPQQITEKLAYLLDIIKARNPSAIIAYNAIIFRPRDIPEQMVEIERMYRLGANYTPPPPPPPPEKPLTAQQKYDALPVMEKKRREINKEIRKYCNANNILFLQSWLKMQKADKTVNLALYARDGIHLNEAGTHTLRIHIEGNAGALINRNQKCLPI